MTADERASALELLEATHVFPGDYAISVVALNHDRVTTEIRIVAAERRDQPLCDGDYPMQHSGGGKYVSHRLSIFCAEAADVLRLYARLRAIEGVVTIL